MTDRTDAPSSLGPDWVLGDDGLYFRRGARVAVLHAADDDLLLSVVDDGPGGAVVHPDHGLAGMKERLAAFGGTFTVMSPPGGPTSVTGRLPLLLRRGEFGVVVKE